MPILDGDIFDMMGVSMFALLLVISMIVYLVICSCRDSELIVEAKNIPSYGLLNKPPSVTIDSNSSM